MQPKWVTVATFNLPHLAHLAKSRLEAEGIPTFIQDENLTRILGYTMVLGGAKLQVPDVDLIAAQQVLASTPDVELSDEEALSAPPIEEPGPEPPELMECPHCGSRGFVEELSHPVERLLNGLLLGLPWLWMGRPLHCRACRHTFRKQ